MSQRQNNNDPQFRQGALIGFIIGGLVALWNAPRSGRQTRRRILQFLRIVQGESVEESLDYGRMIAEQNRSNAAKRSN